MRAMRLGVIALLLTLLAGSALAEPQKKVLVMGVDGLDPRLLQQYMDAGLLPNIKRVVDGGDFKPLTTSMPPLSPVAWSTFITGMDPGGHGVFDFISRDAKTMIPTRAETGTTDGKSLHVGECGVLPMGGGGPENLRKGQAFWELLDEAGIETTIYKMPANFPPVESDGKALSGMGTPDIVGTPGTFSFFTDRYVPNKRSITGGEIFPITVADNHVKAQLIGPPDPFRDQSKEECKLDLSADFDVYLDPERPAAKFEVGDTEFVLQQGEWSDWVRVDFEAVPLLASVSSIGRFYLKQVRPEFELYVTPLQINPEDPAMPISTPESWSHELCEDLGYFYTQELAEDTKALSGGILNGREFWDQTQFIFDESTRAFEHLLGQWDEGMLFFYFSSIDQNAHMLWNYMDPEHPGHLKDEFLADGIEYLYKQLDRIVGTALESIDDETTFIIMSDHGFSPFYWEVNLNSWLLEKGYVTLRDPSKQGQLPVYLNVDWSRTQAYALGLNGLYVNLRGREKNGIVNRGEDHEKLLARLEKDLLAMVDTRNEQRPVSLVINTRRDFHGPESEHGPDILVGYSWGYRSSWKSPLGEFPRQIFLDNTEAWSGDHSMDYRLVPGVLLTNKRIAIEAPALYDLTVGILDEYGVAKSEQMIGQDCLEDRKP